MTAPFAPHPPRLIWAITVGLLVVVIAMPFARRNDWVGWLAFLMIAACAIALWAALISGLVRSVVAWYRERPREGDTAKALGCYQDHVYELTWHGERFAVVNRRGDRIVDVPLDNILDVLDTDALFVDEEVTVNTSPGYVSFPKSRRERAKLLDLIEKLTRSSSMVRQEIQIRRDRFLRRGTLWLPASLTVAAALVLMGILCFPNPPRLIVLRLIVGTVYGLAWGWVIWRFAQSITWLLAGRKLQSILGRP